MDMSGVSPDAGTTLGIPDRRARARQRVSSIACVKIGESNGGIVVNVSEGGLALSAVEALSVENLPPVRIQPPRSREWTEVGAQIAWISESKKEAGIRFVNLTEDSRARIAEWVSAEVAASESRWSKSATPQETPRPSTDHPDPAPATLESAALEASAAEESAANFENAAPVGTAAEPAPDSVASASGSAIDCPLAADRRLRPRRRVKSLAYIQLGDRNGGIITNLNEDGLRVEAAVALADGHIPLMLFQSPVSGDRIEVGGKVAWISECGNEAGIQFIELPEDERANLR